MTGPAAAFYGDDFTGAAENLAQFHRHGLRCRLYIEPADPERIAAEAAELDVVGIAGTARSAAPEEMRPLLRDAFDIFARLGTRLNQYKICSTFDSAPEVGNFAVALELARHYWPEASVLVYPATPDFGRYTAFATLFSRHRGEILRLDRNPALAEHPSTPMSESDLRRHLASLGVAGAAAVMLPELDAAAGAALEALLEARGAGGRPVVIDTVDNVQLERVGGAILNLARRRPVFCLAAQGLPQGLGGGIAAERGRSFQSPPLAPAGPGLVLSGSCSEQTAVQLAAAEAAGWRMIALPVERLRSSEAAAGVVAETLPRVADALRQGVSTAVYTARGRATQAFESGRAALVGWTLSEIFRGAVAESGVRRAIFAGGDSSSHAVRASGAYALEIAASAGRQANHCCRLLSDGALDGVEVILKGGQAGGDDFFLKPL